MALYLWEATCLLINNATELHRLTAASMSAKKGGIQEEKVCRKTVKDTHPPGISCPSKWHEGWRGKSRAAMRLCPVVCSDYHCGIQTLASFKGSSTQKRGKHQSFLLFFYKHHWHLEIGGFWKYLWT